MRIMKNMTTNLINIDNINVIRIHGNSRKINIDKINNIFDIKKIIILFKKLIFHSETKDSLEKNTKYLKILKN